MGDFSESVVLDMFSSPFVDENRSIERLGGSKSDPAVVRRYLDLPIASRPELSVYFDPVYYLHCHADVRDAQRDPLVHFLRWGVAEQRSPHPMIDILHMRMIHPDLLADPPTSAALYDVLSRDLVDPSRFFSLDFYRTQLAGTRLPEGGLLRHFLETGLLEGLRPNPVLDPLAHYYWSQEKTFDIRSGLRDFVLAGGGEGTAREPPAEGQARDLFRLKAEIGQLFRGRAPLEFAVAGPPALTAVVVLRDDFALTLKTLASLRAASPEPIELILVSTGSTDETRHIAQYVHGAVALQIERDIGVSLARNAGLDMATAEAVLFLDNDVALQEGALAAALRRLRSDATIGAVGGKILRAHGVVDEAGGMVWRDGWTAPYQQGRSPLAPEVNFARAVDFCSSAFLLARTSVLQELEGYDDTFPAGSFEDADLCLRVRAAGYRVLYDPAVVVQHQGGNRPGRAALSPEQMEQAHERFLARHRALLRFSHTADPRAHVFARSVEKPRGRVLLIEDQLPLRRLGSGFVRSNDVVRTLAAMGQQVTVYPVLPGAKNLASVYAAFPDSVEVMHDRDLDGLEPFLKVRRGYYDTIWITRIHNLDRVRPVLERGGADVLANVRLVLDCEAIVAPREAQRRALLGEEKPFDMREATRHELRNAYFCQKLVAVSPYDAEQLKASGFPDVHVLGHLCPPALTPNGWRKRAGLLFVGAIHATDSPNYDSLCWFVDAVLPLIERELGHETRLTIAGFLGADGGLERFGAHPRITLRGPVADTGPLYDTHRVFVAPTRYAAGLPYKIHEAASRGLPVVATDLLSRQLGWQDGRDLLAAPATDPAAFAAQVVRLYRSEALWNSLRDNAAGRLQTDCGPETWERALRGILGAPAATP